MEIKDFEGPSNVKIKVETQEEVSDVKSCFIWIADSSQPNLLKETTHTQCKRVKFRKCAVATCNNISTRKDLMFHKFPANESIREIWVKQCGRTDEFSVKNAFMCSDHFEAKLYMNGNKLFELPIGRQSRLISGAIPTINLPNSKMVSYIGDHSSGFVEYVRGEDVMKQDGYTQEENKPTFYTPSWQQIDTVISTPCFDLLASPEQEIYTSGGKYNLDNIVELRGKNTENDCDIISVISSEDADVQVYSDDIDDKSLIDTSAHLTTEDTFLSLLHKYQTLEKSFCELKQKRNKEISRLNNIIKDKEVQYIRELKEILSFSLKPAKVTEIVSQVIW